MPEVNPLPVVLTKVTAEAWVAMTDSPMAHQGTSLDARR